MKRHMRALTGILLATALLAGVMSRSLVAQETDQPPGGGSGNDNAVVAINTHDGMYLFRIGFKITRATGQVVDASNAAVAFSSCTDCQTIAIAYQVVLIFSDPAVVETENIAFAFNLECDFCVSVAYAYQGVFTTGGVVRFTPEGNRALAGLRQELVALRHAELTLEELTTALRDIADRLELIIRTELVSVGPPIDVSMNPETSPESMAPSPSPTTAPEEEATPEPTPTPEPTEPEPSPSPSPTG